MMIFGAKIQMLFSIRMNLKNTIFIAKVTFFSEMSWKFCSVEDYSLVLSGSFWHSMMNHGIIQAKIPFVQSSQKMVNNTLFVPDTTSIWICSLLAVALLIWFCWFCSLLEPWFGPQLAWDPWVKWWRKIMSKWSFPEWNMKFWMTMKSPWTLRICTTKISKCCLKKPDSIF